jgi:hypothetical protein
VPQSHRQDYAASRFTPHRARSSLLRGALRCGIKAALLRRSDTLSAAGRLKKGHLSIRILFNSEKRVLKSFSLNRVPTLPANFKLLALEKADQQRAEYFRNPSGSVYPPMISSCSRCSLILIQAPLRFPSSYREPPRLPNQTFQ